MSTKRSSHELKMYRQSLRKNMTPEEKKLWYRLNRRQVDGFRFRRQHPIASRFILDFYCPEAGIGIEVDGSIHNFQKDQDRNRQKVIESMGIRLLRFTNEEIEDNIEEVINTIRKELIGKRRWK